jgi:hypothetical protein
MVLSFACSTIRIQCRLWARETERGKSGHGDIDAGGNEYDIIADVAPLVSGTRGASLAGDGLREALPLWGHEQ